MRMTFRLILLVLLISAFLCGCSNDEYARGYRDGYSDGQRDARVVSEMAETTEASVPTTPEPQTGYIFEDLLGFESVAPLNIETSGDGGYLFILDPIHMTYKVTDDSYTNDYLAGLAKRYEESHYLKFYVQAGTNFEILVPEGEYEIRYATGEHWVSESKLFGDETKCYACKDTFSFSTSDNNASGWTLQLTPVPNGNLETTQISVEDFIK